MLSLCTTIVKLPQNIGSCRGGPTSIKAVSLDVGCTIGVVFRAKQAPPNRCIAEIGSLPSTRNYFPGSHRRMGCAA
jgi:hypothetical protein